MNEQSEISGQWITEFGKIDRIGEQLNVLRVRENVWQMRTHKHTHATFNWIHCTNDNSLFFLHMIFVSPVCIYFQIAFHFEIKWNHMNYFGIAYTYFFFALSEKLPAEKWIGCELYIYMWSRICYTNYIHFCKKEEELENCLASSKCMQC